MRSAIRDRNSSVLARNCSSLNAWTCGSSALICWTLGSSRLTSRSFFVPKILARMLENRIKDFLEAPPAVDTLLPDKSLPHNTLDVGDARRSQDLELLQLHLELD